MLYYKDSGKIPSDNFNLFQKGNKFYTNKIQEKSPQIILSSRHKLSHS